MTVVASQVRTDRPRSRSVALGLSGRLIILTMSFVMLAEVLVYLPLASSFRLGWLGDRLASARMLALALTTGGTADRSPDQARELLAGIKGAQSIGLRGPNFRQLLAVRQDGPPQSGREIDLREESWLEPTTGLIGTLVRSPDPAVRVVGPGGPLTELPGVEWVELVLDETALRTELFRFTRDYLFVSLLISGLTGSLLYLALHIVVVRPVRRLSANIGRFAARPEDFDRVISPSGRRDEIGRAEEALARMESALAGELRQKRHLADLGLAVSKINHELRNMLTTAQLLGDRLEGVEDPTVRRVAPRLIKTLARAVTFCTATLAYGRATEPAPQRRRTLLRPLVDDQLGLETLPDGHPIRFVHHVPPDLVVDADLDQLSRILLNLVKNAIESLTRDRTPNAAIQIAAERCDDLVVIRVSDNGPGVPDRIRDRLFQAFQASDRIGGTGLGLPVSAELVHLHGGSITLEPSRVGARFRVDIPDRAVA